MVTLPSNVYAFGLDLATVPYGNTFRIELDGIDLGVIVTTPAEKAFQFFGVQSDTAFSEVRIYNTSGPVGSTNGFFDNLSYIIASQVIGGGETNTPGAETPEVASLLAVGTGLFLLGWRRRRAVAAAAA